MGDTAHFTNMRALMIGLARAILEKAGKRYFDSRTCMANSEEGR